MFTAIKKWLHRMFGKTEEKTVQPVKTKKKLSRADKKQIEAAIARANRTDKKGKSAQDSIPYERMWPDGICRVSDSHYTKTIQFQDINYQLSQNEDKTAIFEGWCDFLNYFDSSIHFQLSFLNLAASEEIFANSISIPPQRDAFDSIREEYTTMLQNQLARGNNGLIKTKYLTFGIDADSIKAAKSDFILSLCELIVGGKEGLQPVQKTIIDRCVRLVYNEYLNDPKPENMPILEDLYNLLREQEEKEAQYIATALEIYVTGSLNVFNHQSNVDIDNRIVCYDIKELGKQLKKIGMLVVQDQVWNRVTINRAAHKSTRYYIDEMHLLLKEEQTAAYTVEIWKRFRKWGGIPTGITQNVKDLLSSREVENIFENSDFVYMLNQAGGDRQILAKQLGISTHQLSYVTHSGEGEGLLFYGSTILPFVDHFPKNTELYRIMTTKPQELKKEDE